MAETTARRVADYIVSFLSEHGDPVTNLKLQKLLYYGQAWHLALHDTPLFDERIEAWTHGPVVPPVYGDFKEWAWNPIPPQNEQHLPERAEALVKEVLDVYGSFGAYQLERLTHEEDPWKNARRGLAPDEPSNNIISQDDMKAYYRARLNARN